MVAKVLSARIAKVLNHLITSLTMVMQYQRACSKIRRDFRIEQPIEITSEVQGNHPKLEQNVVKKSFDHLTSHRKPEAVRRMPSQRRKVPDVDS